jgi:hypothetical protein
LFEKSRKEMNVPGTGAGKKWTPPQDAPAIILDCPPPGNVKIVAIGKAGLGL